MSVTEFGPVPDPGRDAADAGPEHDGRRPEPPDEPDVTGGGFRWLVGDPFRDMDRDHYSAFKVTGTGSGWQNSQPPAPMGRIPLVMVESATTSASQYGQVIGSSSQRRVDWQPRERL